MTDTQNRATLWERLKTDDIEPRTKYEDRAEAAAYCRKHLKSRFPEVKFSVRKSRAAGWIECDIMASPYEEESDIMKGIKSYCWELLESREYECLVQVEYGYTQTEPTAEQNADIADYYAQKERERQERIAQYEREQAEQKARWEAERIQEQKDREAIKADVKIIDLNEAEQFVVCRCEEGIGKENSLDKVKERIASGIADGHYHCIDMCISRKLVFTDGEVFERFSHLFMAYFPEYLHGFGGTAFVDTRLDEISQNYTISHWNWCGKLTAEQRADIHSCSVDCVGVYLGDKLQYIIDPQGFNYARYVALPPVGWTADKAVLWTDYEQKHRAYTATLAPFEIDGEKETVTLMSDKR